MEKYRQLLVGLLLQHKHEKVHDTKTNWLYQHIKIKNDRICYISMVDIFFAFAFNEKSFVIAILVFFFFFSFVTFSGRTTKKLLNKRFMISYRKSVWPRSESFLGHTKMSFCKYCSTSCYSRRVSHMTKLIDHDQHSQHPERYKKQSETRKRRLKQVF